MFAEKVCMVCLFTSASQNIDLDSRDTLFNFQVAGLNIVQAPVTNKSELSGEYKHAITTGQQNI